MREDVQTLEDRVLEIAARVVGTEPEDRSAPLGLDSLGRAELAFALEEEFGVRLDDGEDLDTVRGSAEMVASLVGRPNGPESPVLNGVGALQSSATMITPLLRWFYRLRVTGAERVPRSGAAVLASNHESLLDIPILVSACPRPVVFMAKQELYRTRLGAWAFTKLGGFQVRRGASDVRAVRTALAVLRSGRLLGMYPESTRLVGTLLPFFPGAAWAALAEGVPLVPVGISGAGESWPKEAHVPRRVPVRISFGEPIRVQREEDARVRLDRARELTARLRSAVEALLS